MLSAKVVELIVGAVLGGGLFFVLRREGLSLDNPSTRTKTLSIIAGFAVIATAMIEITDALTR